MGWWARRAQGTCGLWHDGVRLEASSKGSSDLLLGAVKGVMAGNRQAADKIKKFLEI